MAKLKSFEEYVAGNDSAEEIEKDMMDMGKPKAAGDGEEVQSPEQEKGAEEVEDAVEGEDAGEEVEDMDEPSSEGEQDMKIGGEVVDTEPKDLSAEIEDQMEDAEFIEVEEHLDLDLNEDEDSDDDDDEDDSDDDEDDSDDDDDEDDSDDEEAEEVETAKEVAEMLKEVYEACKSEAKAWEEDMHDEHTIESYLKENAALVASLAISALKEMKEDMSLEAYEAACESLKESYSKKMDEMKEAWASEGESVDSEDAPKAEEE